MSKPKLGDLQSSSRANLLDNDHGSSDFKHLWGTSTLHLRSNGSSYQRLRERNRRKKQFALEEKRKEQLIAKQIRVNDIIKQLQEGRIQSEKRLKRRYDMNVADIKNSQQKLFQCDGIKKQLKELDTKTRGEISRLESQINMFEKLLINEKTETQITKINDEISSITQRIKTRNTKLKHFSIILQEIQNIQHKFSESQDGLYLYAFCYNMYKSGYNNTHSAFIRLLLFNSDLVLKTLRTIGFEVDEKLTVHGRLDYHPTKKQSLENIKLVLHRTVDEHKYVSHYLPKGSMCY